MTLKELREAVLFETNNDADDLGDFEPHLTDYLNEGYDRLVSAFYGEHVGPESDRFAPLRHEKSTPETPEWTHRAIADWAAWLVYRNGSAQKQTRGLMFKTAFEDALSRVRAMTAAEKAGTAGTKDRFGPLPW